MKDKYLKIFRDEAFELCDELENSLMELESSPENKELINKAFRALHTLKGSSGMFGFDNISMFVHRIENVFEFIRKGELQINSTIIDATLKAVDIIRSILEKKDISEDKTEVFDEIIKLFGNILREFQIQKSDDKGSDKEIIPIEKEKKQIKVYFVKFEPDENIFLTGYNPILALKELANLGDIISVANSDKLPPLADFKYDKCYLQWKILLFSDRIIEDVKDVFIFAEDNAKVAIEKISDSFSYDIRNAEAIANLKELLKTKEVINAKDIASIFEAKEQIEIAERAEFLPKDYKFKKIDKETAIRISSDKLDEFVNLVGELVTVQAKLSEFAFASKSDQLISLAEEVERISWNLRDSAFKARMLPIEATFQNFKRYARDLARELNKEILFETYGGETELDKSVIDKIGEPLSHLLRNALDHGIESPDERVKKGKEKVGKIAISAFYSGSNVIIEFKDDGKGLDRDKIYSRGIENGLLSLEKNYSDEEIYQLIFQPGFSTADKLSNLSGRGVGLDVVKKFIDEIRGSIEVRSQKDMGTTFLLKIPLTLAIIHGLLVKSGNEIFVIPLNFVQKCMEISLSKSDLASQRVIYYDNSALPFVDLRDFFGYAKPDSKYAHMVVVSENDIRYGIIGDKILGEKQVVVKSLSKLYAKAKHISGSAILGDGSIALILDIKAIYESMLENA